MSDALKGQIVLGIMTMVGLLFNGWLIRRADRRSDKAAQQRQDEVKLQIRLAHAQTNRKVSRVGKAADKAYKEANFLNEKIARVGEEAARVVVEKLPEVLPEIKLLPEIKTAAEKAAEAAKRAAERTD